MTRAQDTAYRLRRLLLAAGALCFAAGVWALFGFPPFDIGASVFGTPAMVPSLVSGDDLFYANAAIFLGLILLVQWLFLRPRARWVPRLAAFGRPLRTSVAAAAFMAMLLNTGAVATVLELPNLWAPLMDEAWSFYGVWAAMAVVWLAWSVIFFRYWRQGDRYTQLGRMTRALLAGSLLETLVAAPVQAFLPDGPSRGCYCARGSYTGLVFGLTVMLWCFGPGLALLFLRERCRRERLLRGPAMECAACGYDLRGTPGASCPECGAARP